MEKMTVTEKDRLKQIRGLIPDVFEYKSLLYIGASPNRAELLSAFEAAGYRILILEAWGDNARILAQRGHDVVHGDVRQIGKHISGKYDIVLWWHGPEHLSLIEAGFVLGRLEAYANIMVVAGSPHGKYEQGAVDGNPHEKHLCELYPDSFRSIGWKAEAYGMPDVKGSNLIGWKRT